MREIQKEDLNNYQGKDNLKISLYDSKSNLIEERIIKDDGIFDSSKKMGKIQEGEFSVRNLEEGIYKIKIEGNDDILIKNIKINSDKLIILSPIYPNNELNLYFKSKGKDIIFRSIHSDSIQNVNIRDELEYNINKMIFPGNRISIKLSDNNKLFNLKLEKGDLFVENIEFFSFTKESYFDPFKFTLLEDNEIKNAEFVFLKENYILPEESENTLILKTKFYVKDIEDTEGREIRFLLDFYPKEEISKSEIYLDSIEVKAKK